MAILYVMQKKHIDFTFRVLGALIMGLALGFLLAVKDTCFKYDIVENA